MKADNIYGIEEKSSVKENNSIKMKVNKSLVRKHGELEREIKEEKEQVDCLKLKMDILYDKFQSDMNPRWKDEFMLDLRQENIMSVTQSIPRSLCIRGSYLMEYTKFWILWIEVKFPELDLLGTVEMINNALLFKQSEKTLLEEYMNTLLIDNFELCEIHAALSEINSERAEFNIPLKPEDVKEEHFKYLLERPEALINTISQTASTPLSRSSTKSIHSSTLKIRSGIKSNLKNQTGVKSISNDRKGINIQSSNNKDENTSAYEISFQSEMKISKSKIEYRESENFKPLNNIKVTKSIRNTCLNYDEIVERNKYNLSLENILSLELIPIQIRKAEIEEDLITNNSVQSPGKKLEIEESNKDIIKIEKICDFKTMLASNIEKEEPRNSYDKDLKNFKITKQYKPRVNNKSNNMNKAKKKRNGKSINKF